MLALSLSTRRVSLQYCPLGSPFQFGCGVMIAYFWQVWAYYTEQSLCKSDLKHLPPSTGFQQVPIWLYLVLGKLFPKFVGLKNYFTCCLLQLKGSEGLSLDSSYLAHVVCVSRALPHGLTGVMALGFLFSPQLPPVFLSPLYHLSSSRAETPMEGQDS